MTDNFPGQRHATHDKIEVGVREWFGASVELRQGKQNKLRWIKFPSLADCREHAARTKNVKLPGLPTVH